MRKFQTEYHIDLIKAGVEILPFVPFTKITLFYHFCETYIFKKCWSDGITIESITTEVIKNYGQLTTTWGYI